MSDVLSNISTITVKITNRLEQEFDITQQFLLCNIWQSLIHKKFMTGRIVLADTNDLITNLPIIGYEKLSIRVNNSYDTEFHDYNFRIYKIDRDFSTTKTTQKVKILNIYLYSEEEFKSFTKISKRFTGTGESIVQQILINNLETTKVLNSETNSSSIDFVSNFWNMDKCIDYICKKTQSSYKDFIFYESNEGFNFKSLSYLFTQDAKSTLKYDNSENMMATIDSFSTYQFNGYFDDLMWRKKEMFGSRGYIIDPDVYGYEILEKTIDEIDDEIYHTGKNRMYNDEVDSLNRVYKSYTDDFDDVKNVRTTHLNLLSRYNLVLTLNGDISRNVGDIYDIDFPALDNESPLGSDSFSGKWIATEINTQIWQNGSFKQNLSLSKNSLFQNKKLNTF